MRGRGRLAGNVRDHIRSLGNRGDRGRGAIPRQAIGDGLLHRGRCLHEQLAQRLFRQAIRDDDHARLAKHLGQLADQGHLGQRELGGARIAIVQFRSKVSFIAQLMGISWGALAGAFLAPFLYGLYWKRATAASVWTTFIFGAALMAANFLFNGSFPALLRSPINCGAFAMIAGLVLVPVVSVFTKPPKKNLVDEMFSCYDTRVSVKINKYMGE